MVAQAFPEYPILLGRTGRWFWQRYIKLPGTEHIAVHAQTGAGKTSNFVIPNAFAWPGSIVVLDVKGEVFNATAGHRHHRLKQQIIRFDPTSLDGRSHCLNPFDSIDRTSLRRFDQIARQAFLLFPDHPNNQSNAAVFWIPAARQAFVAVSAMIAEMPDQPFTLANVLHIFTRGDGPKWLAGQIEYRRAVNQPFSMQVVSGISDFLGSGAGDLVENIRKSVSTVLQAFYNPQVAAATSRSDFDLRQLRRIPMSVYVTIAPGHIPRMRSLLRLFFDQLVNLNTDRTPTQDPTLRVPVLVILDEFARLDRMTSLSEAAQYARGFGLRFAYVIQDKSQMYALYGQNGATDIFSNLGAEVVFGTADLKLAKEFEERLGDDTVLFNTQSKPRFFPWARPTKQNIAQHPHRRPVRLDQEILQMSRKKQLIVRTGMLPAESERIVWWKDQHFRNLVCEPPEIPLLAVSLSLDDGSISIGPPPKIELAPTRQSKKRPVSVRS